MKHYYLFAESKIPGYDRKGYVICVTSRAARDIILDHPGYFGLDNVELLVRDAARVELRFGKQGIGCYLGSRNAKKNRSQRLRGNVTTTIFGFNFKEVSEYVPGSLVRLT